MTNFEDYGSRHLSFEACEFLAQQIRNRMGCGFDEPVGPISEVLALWNIVPVIRSADEMGDARAYAEPATNDIFVREEMTIEIIEDTPRARHTIVHEIVHLVDHRHVERMYRKASGNELMKFYSLEESVEGQADSIADAVTMPEEMVRKFPAPRDLADHARVPLERAFVRMNLVKSRSPRTTPPQISAAIAKQKELAREGAGFRRVKTTLNPETEARLLWELAETTDGPSDEFRCIDRRYTIRWSRLDMMKPAGWRVFDGRIVPWESENSK